MFSGFKSLWIKLFLWSYSNPLHISLVNYAANSSLITNYLPLMVGLLSSPWMLTSSWLGHLTSLFLDLMNDSNVPPFIFSISMNTWLFEYRILLKNIMFSCFTPSNTCCSVRSVCNNAFLLSWDITLRALVSLVFMLTTSKTIPKAPNPRRF